jgi:hypothetical protein
VDKIAASAKAASIDAKPQTDRNDNRDYGWLDRPQGGSFDPQEYPIQSMTGQVMVMRFLTTPFLSSPFIFSSTLSLLFFLTVPFSPLHSHLPEHLWSPSTTSCVLSVCVMLPVASSSASALWMISCCAIHILSYVPFLTFLPIIYVVEVFVELLQSSVNRIRDISTEFRLTWAQAWNPSRPFIHHHRCW